MQVQRGIYLSPRAANFMHLRESQGVPNQKGMQNLVVADYLSTNFI